MTMLLNLNLRIGKRNCTRIKDDELKITTDSIKYHSKVNKLLTSGFDVSWTPLWNYCEMTSLLIEGHSWTFLIRDGLENRKLIYRSWKCSEKNNFGIFNLDNIRINEEELSISLNRIFEIQNRLKADLSINKFKGIILDGMDYELTDFKIKRRYEWKLDQEMNSNMKELIKIITAHNNA